MPTDVMRLADHPRFRPNVTPGDETVTRMHRGNLNEIWDGALMAYLIHLAAAGASAGTVRLRRSYLLRVAALHPRLESITTGCLEQWLSNATWKPETRKSARASLTMFFAWAAKRGWLPTNPADDLPTVSIPDADARPAPADVIRQAFDRADQSGDPRDSLMLYLALHAGLRVHEIAKVHADHVEGDELRVRGKGGRSRLIPMSPALRLAMRHRTGYLFPGREDGHLSAGYVQKKIDRLLPAGWTPHALRHAAAEAVYEASGCDLFATQAFLGHSKPETTRRYVPVKRKRLRQAVLDAAGHWPNGEAS